MNSLEILISLFMIGSFLSFFLVWFAASWIMENTNESILGKIIGRVLIIGHFPSWIIGGLIYLGELSAIKAVLGFSFFIGSIYLIFYFYSKNEFESFLIRQFNKVLEKIIKSDENSYPFLATFGFVIMIGLVFIIIDTATGIFIYTISIMVNHWFFILSLILIWCSKSLWFSKKANIYSKIILALFVAFTIYFLKDFKDEYHLNVEYKTLIMKYLNSHGEGYDN